MLLLFRFLRIKKLGLYGCMYGLVCISINKAGGIIEISPKTLTLHHSLLLCQVTIIMIVVVILSSKRKKDKWRRRPRGRLRPIPQNYIVDGCNAVRLRVSQNVHLLVKWRRIGRRRSSAEIVAYTKKYLENVF